MHGKVFLWYSPCDLLTQLPLFLALSFPLSLSSNLGPLPGSSDGMSERAYIHSTWYVVCSQSSVARHPERRRGTTAISARTLPNLPLRSRKRPGPASSTDLAVKLFAQLPALPETRYYFVRVYTYYKVSSSSNGREISLASRSRTPYVNFFPPDPFPYSDIISARLVWK